jgi:hypothetical protein
LTVSPITVNSIRSGEPMLPKPPGVDADADLHGKSVVLIQRSFRPAIGSSSRCRRHAHAGGVFQGNEAAEDRHDPSRCIYPETLVLKMIPAISVKYSLRIWTS